MALYGSIDGAKKLIRVSGDTTFSPDEEARLVDLQKLASRTIERETGRVWGGTPAAEIRVIAAPGVSPVLILPEPVRAVSAIVVGGIWDGSLYSGGTALTTADWRLTHQLDTGEYLAITAIEYGAPFWGLGMSGYWYGPVSVTGIWQDADATPVPDDITYIANLMISHWFRVEKAGPTGFQGPDGATIPIRKILGDERVKPVLDHYRVTRLVAV